MVFIIGVAGGSGSGKSTVTEQIINSVEKNSVSVFLQDNYYLDRSHLTMAEREQINFDHPNALDWDLMKSQLKNLYEGNQIEQPVYEFSTHTRSSKIQKISPAKIIIVEGIFALYDEWITKHMALRIFVDTAPDIQLMRRLKRDIVERERTLDSVLEMYSQRVRPMYKKFVEPTKRRAHIIIPHGSNKAALEMIVSRIKSVINNQNITISSGWNFEEDDGVI